MIRSVDVVGGDFWAKVELRNGDSVCLAYKIYRLWRSNLRQLSKYFKAKSTQAEGGLFWSPIAMPSIFLSVCARNARAPSKMKINFHFAITILYFVRSGHLYALVNHLSNAGTAVHSWSCSALFRLNANGGTTPSAYNVYTDNSSVNPSYNYERGRGYPLRCAQNPKNPRITILFSKILSLFILQCLYFILSPIHILILLYTSCAAGILIQIVVI